MVFYGHIKMVFTNDFLFVFFIRYYLKGPVVFTDVTWFCEDCATKLGVPPALDQSTPISFVSRNNNI